ncbi:MAG: DUF3857 domain-containing transglutaminase family protein [Mucilaginibacter polytrichastri]|nr:DUF3857 domain-containing transglutaminase family protein [Mucilaginibacter polytrichastri]
MKNMLILLCCVASLPALAQSNYAVSEIPSELKARARAVVRNYDVRTEVKDPGTVIYRVKKAVTILNKNGDGEARMALYYDKNNRIGYVKGVIYDEQGQAVGKISEKNFTDLSAVDGFSLHIDDRVKRFSPAINTYPYTIEYEMEMRFRHTMYFPAWRPVVSTGVSVQQSACTFLARPDFRVRFRSENFHARAEEGSEGEYKTIRFSMKNLPAFRDEPYSPTDEEILPAVYFAPEKFVYNGMAGGMNSWSEYGKWFYDKLIAGRDQLSPATVTRITDVVKGAADEREKVRRVYTWMQQHTRYVSIQIGIGGLQPSTAADVDRLGYGDCKGLVNYTKALLQAVGIPSWYTMVSAGSEKHSFPADFPVEDGNHVILCVPVGQERIWLECTSKDMPFGFLSSFTDDRNVLACTPEGGKLLRTPAYPASHNRQTRRADVKMDAEGTIAGQITTLYDGIQVDNLDYLTDESAADQKKLLVKHYAINNLDISRFAVETDQKIIARKTETLQFNAPNFATATGNRLYFYPNLANKVSSIPGDVRNRTQKVKVKRGYEDVDEISYLLPEHYKPEYLPPPALVKNEFGEYKTTVEYSEGKLRYIRSVRMNEVTRPAEEYPQLIEFFEKMYEADNMKLTLIRKDASAS